MLYRGCIVCVFFAALAFAGGFERLHGAEPWEPGRLPEIVDDAKAGQSGPTRHYDPLPMTMEAMDEYDRIAMEPYADRYDDLPLHEKAELYSRQFRYMRARDPQFLPEVNIEIQQSRAVVQEADGADNPADGGIAEPGTSAGVSGNGDPLPSQGVFDALPRRIADMGEYERIAMEPYADRYDKMPLHEKAELYAKQFEFMNGRAPIFSPEVRAAVRRSADAPTQANQAARRDIYKEPEDRKKRRHGMDLSKLSGPWDANRKPEESDGVYVVNPDGTLYQESDTRMESLRGGWDSRDLLRTDR